MDDVNDIPTDGQVEPQPDPTPLVPSEPVQPINSRFLFVDVAALRAKQLRRGARVRLDGSPEAGPTPHKAERVAMEEVRRGLVYYDIPEWEPSRLITGEM